MISACVDAAKGYSLGPCWIHFFWSLQAQPMVTLQSLLLSSGQAFFLASSFLGASSAFSSPLEPDGSLGEAPSAGCSLGADDSVDSLPAAPSDGASVCSVFSEAGDSASGADCVDPPHWRHTTIAVIPVMEYRCFHMGPPYCRFSRRDK